MAHGIATGIADITARELTLREARELLRTHEDALAAGQDGSDEPWEDITLREIEKITSYPMEKLETLPLGDLRKVADACRKVNPDFFGKKDRRQAEIDRVKSLSPESLDRLLTLSERSGAGSKKTLPGLPG